MTREEKALIIDELSEKLNSNGSFYITDASGFTVEQINAFRRVCFEKGLEYKVYKNTLIKKALDDQDADYSELDEALKGYSGIIFSSETAKAPAQAIKEYRKKGMVPDYPILKAASIDNDVYVGDQHLTALSELKSREELLGEIIGLLQSPAKNVISALESGKNNIAGILKTLGDRPEA